MLTNGVLRVQLEYPQEIARAAFELICEPGAQIITARLTDNAAIAQFQSLGSESKGTNPSCGDNEFEKLPTPPDKKGGELAKLTGQFCTNPDFYDFMLDIKIDPFIEKHETSSWQEWCAEAVRRLCKIKSRAELDHNVDAAKIFHERVRIPFLEWQKNAELS